MATKRKKLKVTPCKHERTRVERGYELRSDSPMDGYCEVYYTTCTACNKQISQQQG